MVAVGKWVALGLVLLALLALAFVVANDDRLEVGRLSRELCGSYLDGGNYFAIFLLDMAWLAACGILAATSWAFLLAGVLWPRSRPKWALGVALWWALAAVSLAVIFIGSDVFVDWFAADFTTTCPNGPVG